MTNRLIVLFSILLLFKTIKGSEILLKKDEQLSKALPLKGNRPQGVNLWVGQEAAGGPIRGGFADDSGNQVRQPIGQWEQPRLPVATDQNRPIDQADFTSIGIGKSKPDSGLPGGERSKERGWHNWNSPSLDSDNEWGNSWSNEPSLMPLPQASWANGNGPEKPWGGGRQKWGLPNLPETISWNEPSGPGLLPSPHLPDDKEGWDEPQWGSSSSNSISNSLDSQDSDWSTSPQWGSSNSNTNNNNNNINNNNNNNNNKPVCNCDNQRQTQQTPNNQELPIRNNRPNYPNYPANPSFIPIRGRPQKQQAWNQLENMPWTSWERGLKDTKSKLKDIGATKVEEEIGDKVEDRPQTDANEKEAPPSSDANEVENKT